MRKLALLFVMALVLLSASALCGQDLTIGVDASFVPIPASVVLPNGVPNPGFTPSFPANGITLDLVGQFTFNELTNQVLSWDLTYSGLASATVVGSTPFTIACGIGSSCSLNNVGELDFNIGGANLQTSYMNGGGFLPGDGLTVGETIALCPNPTTQYGSTIVGTNVQCSYDASTLVNGQNYEIYSQLATDNSSGTLDILASRAETPELPSWMLLAAGAVLLGLFEMLRRRA
jgi:hypothetical protein